MRAKSGAISAAETLAHTTNTERKRTHLLLETSLERWFATLILVMFFLQGGGDILGVADVFNHYFIIAIDPRLLYNPI